MIDPHPTGFPLFQKLEFHFTRSLIIRSNSGSSRILQLERQRHHQEKLPHTRVQSVSRMATKAAAAFGCPQFNCCCSAPMPTPFQLFMPMRKQAIVLASFWPGRAKWPASLWPANHKEATHKLMERTHAKLQPGTMDRGPAAGYMNNKAHGKENRF